MQNPKYNTEIRGFTKYLLHLDVRVSERVGLVVERLVRVPLLGRILAKAPQFLPPAPFRIQNM